VPDLHLAFFSFDFFLVRGQKPSWTRCCRTLAAVSRLWTQSTTVAAWFGPQRAPSSLWSNLAFTVYLPARRPTFSAAPTQRIRRTSCAWIALIARPCSGHTRFKGENKKKEGVRRVRGGGTRERFVRPHSMTRLFFCFFFYLFFFFNHVIFF
jgi:hypothetical protein